MADGISNDTHINIYEYNNVQHTMGFAIEFILAQSFVENGEFSSLFILSFFFDLHKKKMRKVFIILDFSVLPPYLTDKMRIFRVK